MKQYKGVRLEKRAGSKIICTEKFTRLNQNNKAYRDQIEYRFPDCDHPYNIWLSAAEIKEKINEALTGNKFYNWVPVNMPS